MWLKEWKNKIKEYDFAANVVMVIGIPIHKIFIILDLVNKLLLSKNITVFNALVLVKANAYKKWKARHNLIECVLIIHIFRYVRSDFVFSFMLKVCKKAYIELNIYLHNALHNNLGYIYRNHIHYYISS